MGNKLLVVDDDRINTTLLKFMLAERGYVVVVAYDGVEGLRLVETEKPDLIILDVKMPTMNGYEFITELKNQQGYRTTPVIMLTANETLESVFTLEGVCAYFVKPVVIPDLIKKIEERLGPQ